MSKPSFGRRTYSAPVPQMSAPRGILFFWLAMGAAGSIILLGSLVADKTPHKNIKGFAEIIEQAHGY